jgi:hypothetical protein
LLGYRDARFQTYLPAYKWVLENRLVAQVKELGQLLETNTDTEDLSSPMSHAALIKYYLEGNWPTP